MKLIPTLMGLLASCSLCAQDGTLDPYFGTGGTVSTTISGRTVLPERQKLYVYPDGRMLQVFTVTDGSNSDFGLIRYLNDDIGTPDASFSGDGIVLTDLSGDDRATSLLVQEDGKIVVGGTNAAGQFVLVRYTAAGVLDATFGTGGVVTATMGMGDVLTSITLVAGGKIAAAGYTNEGADIVFAVARFNANGTPDASFSGDGKLTLNFPGSGPDLAYACAEDLGFGLLVAGSTNNGGGNLFAVARILSNGTPDAAFSGDGMATVAIGSDAAAYAVRVQPDNKILLGGYGVMATGSDFAVARLSITGVPDGTFGAAGISTLDISGTDAVYGLGVQGNGAILMTGSTALDSDPADAAIARFLASGLPDYSFGGKNTGYNTYDLGGEDAAYALASQGPNVVVAGVAGVSLSIARVLNSFAILPVTMRSFTAEEGRDGVLLSWTTAQEYGLEKFVVERSSNGRDFSPIAEVAPKGFTLSDADYTHTDEEPARPLSYYRLKMVDRDGSVQYTAVRKVQVAKAALKLTAYPNPVRGELFIKVTPPAGTVITQVSDAAGRLVEVVRTPSSGHPMTLRLNTASWKPGVYLVQVNGTVLKVVRQ